MEGGALAVGDVADGLIAGVDRHGGDAGGLELRQRSGDDGR
jgi:hypothetical protein